MYSSIVSSVISSTRHHLTCAVDRRAPEPYFNEADQAAAVVRVELGKQNRS
jgi:hypothetical protein